MCFHKPASFHQRSSTEPGACSINLVSSPTLWKLAGLKRTVIKFSIYLLNSAPKANMDPPFFISHNTPAIKPVHTLLESSNYNRSPQPHLSLPLPLPLPVKEQPKFSLPSISTLFGDADSARHTASE